MLTDLMCTLAETKPALTTSIVVIFIANEENGVFKGIGVDQLALEGHLDRLLPGPVFWVDSADAQPCIGTAGNLQWKLDISGKAFHSGLPHKGINAIELGVDTVAYLQARFFEAFPAHPLEKEYNFATQSTFKATRIQSLTGAVNQIPGDCTIEGDVRLAPFYDVKDVRTLIEATVAEINTNPTILEGLTNHGPHSKYTLPLENLQGKITLTWLFAGENGVACKLTSPGHLALKRATHEVLGTVVPYGIGGSLPLIRDLQEKGFDVQIAGYGLSSLYHADNESATLSGMKNATLIIAKVSVIISVYMYMLYLLHWYSHA